MHQLLRHVRSNAVAYVALFVALGGTGYAALRLPANSVGNRQIQNGSVTPVKLDRQLTAGAVRVWAEVNANGRLVAGEGSPKSGITRGAVGQFFVTWRAAAFSRCTAVGGIALPGGTPLTPGSVLAQVQTKPEATTVSANVYDAQGQPAAIPFWVAVLC